ncbi:hypothetical protein [uncultured Muribaculum sp.]|uniref:hypothetical protein n=1 Tax=uncultured Muribaculum sp. TaxID=1918613 RepID=UPI0025E10BB8|nr:hypothetical protein [uncultured Muribaculum sp.]
MTHLSDEDMEWINVYGNGEYVLFVSNVGNTDTLSIKEIILFNSKNPFYFSEAGGSTYRANGGYRFILHHNIEKFHGLAFFEKELDDSLYFSLTLGKSYLKYPMNTYDREILVMDSINIAYSEYGYDIPNKVKEGVWSKEHGLIYYKFEDGEEFFRQDLLPGSIQMKNQS